MNITLPWPQRCLHPNSRAHWRVRAVAVKVAHNYGYLITALAMGRGVPIFEGRAHLAFVFRAPNNRKHDLDGCLSANKAAIDGIAHALGLDDCNFRYSLERGSPIKGGAVEVAIHAY